MSTNYTGLATAFALWLAAVSVAAGEVRIDCVIVADPGNACDSTGFGRVDYTYQIGKYEVTNSQYCEFLNAVAAVGDPQRLYDWNMGGGWYDIGGIARTGSGTAEDPRVYSVRPNRGSRPVSCVTFWDVCRFANWLHNAQPTGPQDLASTEDGAYLLNGVTNPPYDSVQREPDARVWIPSEDEWYKAAYYKGGGTDEGYWDYPTGSDARPANDVLPTDPGNNANYWDGAYEVGAPYWTTEVGEYENSTGPYGTFDQAGNVAEWNEAIVTDLCRGKRGGAFFDGRDFMLASYRCCHCTSWDSMSLGFRVAAIPEPATLLLLTLGGLALIARRPRWKRG